jgi:(1->4)-alpha-D-glucan 1-alpha-D-glucosylmutase
LRRVGEKFLARGEALPGEWRGLVDGTTGYDAAARLAGLFVDPTAEAVLTGSFEQATETAWEPAAARRLARLEVLGDALHSELARLADLAVRVCAACPSWRDFTRAEIEAALAQILAGYPVYRTYGRPDGEMTPIDRDRIASAVAAVPAELDRDLVHFLGAALAFELGSPDARELAAGAQQLTGAVIAKGDEDTLGYRFVRLLARCEVGADPAVFADSPIDVHAALAASGARNLLATSTHDTKRGEDVRARLAVLSEVPAAWDAAWLRWRARAERHWDVAPDRLAEYTLWQTLVGAWPLPIARAQQYALKAAREARLRTSWRKPDAAYEAALARWIQGVYADAELVAEIGAFAGLITQGGDRNSLAQLAIKLCAPGVPDLYQGTELRDDNLVDPDNRRPVDLAARRRALRELEGRSAQDVAAADLGARKLWLLRRVLGLRAAQPELFRGLYRPLETRGPHARRAFAFTRGDDLAVIVPRLGTSAEGWAHTTVTLADGAWRDVLAERAVDGGAVAVGELFRAFPVAVLVK